MCKRAHRCWHRLRHSTTEQWMAARGGRGSSVRPAGRGRTQSAVHLDDLAGAQHVLPDGRCDVRRCLRTPPEFETAGQQASAVCHCAAAVCSNAAVAAIDERQQRRYQHQKQAGTQAQLLVALGLDHAGSLTAPVSEQQNINAAQFFCCSRNFRAAGLITGFLLYSRQY